MSKTVSIITENFGKYDPSSIDSYLSIGGFSAVKKALSMSSGEIIEMTKKSAVRGRGGAAYDTEGNGLRPHPFPAKGQSGHL